MKSTNGFILLRCFLKLFYCEKLNIDRFLSNNDKRQMFNAIASFNIVIHQLQLRKLENKKM